MKRSRGAVFQAGAPKLRSSQRAKRAAQLSPRQRACVPDSDSGRCIHSTKAESGRLRTGSRCTPGSSCTGRDSGGCGALQKVCSIRLEPPLRLRGGGSCRSPSRCRRSMATRQLISLRPPSALRHWSSRHANRDSWARVRPGFSAIKAPSCPISSPSAAAVALHAASRPEGRPQAALWAGSISQGSSSIAAVPGCPIRRRIADVQQLSQLAG